MSAPKVFCYVSSWARDRPGRGRFTPADLDPSLCTHVVWAFAKIINGAMELPSPDQNQRDEDSDYQQLLRLREANPKLKVSEAQNGQPQLKVGVGKTDLLTDRTSRYSNVTQTGHIAGLIKHVFPHYTCRL